MESSILFLTTIFLLSFENTFFIEQFVGILEEEFDHLLLIYKFNNNDEGFVGCLVYLRETWDTP